MSDYTHSDVLNLEKAVRDVGDFYTIAQTCPLGGKEMNLLLARSFIQFKSDPLRTPAQDQPHTKFWHAIHALEAINGLCSRLAAEPNANATRALSILRENIPKQWPNIWKWVECGSVRCLNRKKYPLEPDMYDWLASILYQFMIIAFRGPNALRRSPHFSELAPVVDLWYLQTRELHLNHDPTSFPTMLIHKAMGRSTTEDNNVLQCWELMVARSGRTSEELAAIIILYFAHLLHEPSNPDGVPVVILHAVLIISLARTQYTNNILLAHDAIYIFTRGLVHYYCKGIEGVEGTRSPTIVRDKMCIYLRDRFRVTVGITWIRQSLEAGLLLGILRCAPRDPSDKADGLVDITSHISQCLIFVSILRAVSRSINKIDVEHLEEKLAHEGPFWDAWTQLKNMVEERLTLAGGRISKLCNNKECGTMDIRADFKRCGGCEAVSYCSLGCQKLDWAKGHREYCVKAQEDNKAGGSVDSSDEDLAFARHVFWEDLNSRRLDIEKMYGTRHPRNLHFQMDYTCIPPKAHFSKLESRCLRAYVPWGQKALELNLDDEYES